jgi:hypothetical protein
MADTNDKRKRVLTPSAEQHLSSRRKLDISDESNTSNKTEATTSSLATSVDPEESQKMDQDFTFYYVDLRGRPKLVARSSNEPWIRPLVKVVMDRDSPATPFSHEHAEKQVFTVGKHPLRQKLEAGLRDSVLQVLSTLKPNKWISVDYLRIGYEKVAEDNPVVILITVEKDQIAYGEAKRVVDEVKTECTK